MPLAFSFEKRIKFAKRWSSLFPAIGIVALIFILWDMYFTKIGVWSFSPNYLTGIEVGNLPLEEILFFILIPYSCIFIHDALRWTKWPQKVEGPWVNYLIYAVAIFCLIGAVIFRNKLYTSWTFIGVFLWNVYFICFGNKNKNFHLPTFLIAFLIIQIPFFIVNGALTRIPVVNYNDMENIGLRMGTIPVEDVFYNWLMLFPMIYLYTYFSRKK